MKDKKLLFAFLIIFICFIFDSTISFFLPYNYTRSSLTIVPYIGMMMFTLVTKDIEGVERYFFAAICGVYYSIVYSNSLAIFILIYCLITFVRTYMIRIESFSMLESAVFSIATILVCECSVYFLMWSTNTTHIGFISFALMRLLPTIVVNFVLSFIVYGVYQYSQIGVKRNGY